MDAAALMPPLRLRALTAGERELAKAVFDGALRPERVRMLALPVWRRAFAAGPGLLVFPARLALTDFSLAPAGLQGLFVHELTHVWQAQNGVGLLRAKLRAGDRPSAYVYDLLDGRPFGDLNIEQQAMVVQHAFLASRGQEGSHSASAYGAYLAGWTAPQRDKPWKV